MQNKSYKLAFNCLMNCFTSKIDHYFGTSYSKPFSVCAAVTMACNMRCKQCTIWRENKPVYQLSTDEWKYIIKKIRAWFGVFFLHISGGEPLLRKDIFDLIQYSNKLGITTEMITNSYLIDKKCAKKIIKSELNKLIISIDGIGETHDYLRGVKGLFKRVERAVRMINNLKEKYDSKLKLSFNTMISRHNIYEVNELMALAKENNCFIYFRPVLPIRSTIFKNNCHVNSELWPNYNDVSEVIDMITMMKKRGFPVANSEEHLKAIKMYFKNTHVNLKNFNISCKAPFRYLYITSNGNIRVCGETLGNVLKSKLTDIRQELNKVRNRRKDCGRFCALDDYLWTNNLIRDYLQINNLNNIKRLWQFLDA